MMNVAPVGGATGLDPSMLVGIGVTAEKAWQWQSPTPALAGQHHGIQLVPTKYC